MSEGLWVGLLVVIIWASLPVSLIIANKDFDSGVVRPGEDAHHH